MLASLGLKSLAEARGRTDLLKAVDGSRFDFSEMLAQDSTQRLRDTEGQRETSSESPCLCDSVIKQNYDFRELIPAVEHGETELKRKIANRDRSVGAALSGWLVENRGTGNGERGTVVVDFTGVAGQSFGAFLAHGVTFNLRGEANDYIGKSLSGGVVTIRPPENPESPETPAFRPEDNIIAGNVIAYGATSGAIYINGLAGERFGIRNSGATLVAEGVGDHGCEYMTGGIAVVIGPVGVNFAAGMTGGVAYVYDETATLDLNSNLDSVDIFPVEAGSDDEAELVAKLREHVARTGSPKAQRLLADWANARPMFSKVVPVRE